MIFHRADAEPTKTNVRTVGIGRLTKSSLLILHCVKNHGCVYPRKTTRFSIDYAESSTTNGTGYERIWRRVGDEAEWEMATFSRSIFMVTARNMASLVTWISRSLLE
jgi:hypothetical protein